MRWGSLLSYRYSPGERFMRRIMAICALCVLAVPVGYETTAQSVAGSWLFLPAAPDAGGVRLRHDDVFFIDHMTGWVVNLRGEVWMTDDGGVSWTKTFDNGGVVGFRSVGFADAELGWAGSVLNPGAVLFETTDGGYSWVEISDRIVGPVPTGVCGIHALNRQVVYGAGVFHGDPHIIQSLNGGVTWTSQNVNSLARTLVDIHFVDTSVGFAVGGTGTDLDGNAVV
ncbi:MAG: hypothetical protein HKN13_04555, partial [Rhodothermales bacterium]|nr:hypothetical protein [Rhodothermales bacterium]